MKKLTYLVPAFCLAALTLSSAVARAGTVNLTVSPTPISMKVEAYPAPGENNGQFYVGLTDVQLSTTGGSLIGTFSAFCDDFTHEITLPDTYNVVVTAVAGNTTYEQEAYYGTMFDGNSATDSDLQELIWDLGDPSADPYPIVAGGALANLQITMLGNYLNANYSDDFYLNAGSNGQSFMIDGTPAPTPEPPTLLTLATGLIGLAFFARRRVAQA